MGEQNSSIRREQISEAVEKEQLKGLLEDLKKVRSLLTGNVRENYGSMIRTRKGLERHGAMGKNMQRLQAKRKTLADTIKDSGIIETIDHYKPANFPHFFSYCSQRGVKAERMFDFGIYADRLHPIDLPQALDAVSRVEVIIYGYLFPGNKHKKYKKAEPTK